MQLEEHKDKLVDEWNGTDFWSDMPYQPPSQELASNLGILYKYKAILNDAGFEQAASMIRECSLWFWHLTGQNDVNECKPNVSWGGDRKALYRYFLNDLRNEYPGADSRHLKEKARKAARNPITPPSEMVYRNWGVCCFSAKGNCSHMWQYYGGDGAGMVIAYRASSGSSLGLAGRVKYTDTPIDFAILELDNEDEAERKCYEIFTTKEKKWAIEEEYRIVERLTSPNSGKNVICSDVQILSIVIGNKLEEKYRNQLEKLCANTNVPILAQLDA